MHNNRIVVKLVTVLSLLVYACSFCSCTWFELYSSEDIYGYWKCNYQDRTLVAYVHDSVFDVFCFWKDSDELDTSIYWSGSFVEPEGKFYSYKWESVLDYDRSTRPENWSSLEYLPDCSIDVLFKSNKLYVNFYGDLTFEKIDYYPKCDEIAKDHQLHQDISHELELIDVVEMNCFDCINGNSEEGLLVMRTINTNSYGLYYPEYVLYTDDRRDYQRIYNWDYLPPESEMYVVGKIKDISTDYSLDNIEAYYNLYSVDIYGDHPSIDIVDSQIVMDSSNNKVEEVIVNTEVQTSSVCEGTYNLYIVFYFDNELVGAGIGSASYSTSTVSITDLSTITEFDNYEIYVG